ncbi:hypothetical protein ONS95_000966 [Cadophora gregata]|uniref:uncharacterized protein n=1 Tax=Cadophora gregata TaxID=51156 RepID=UPI0026DAFFAE|nr:uncharacterized protein ONS95_000966 [Cadophora gregata]KAK0102835.1 hypothetical protein ONS96_005467 [Cadophora gregata f. sp. sojae]KAK0129026.1 hypothetical protein ONS95_000966 [Cadophora gregata]
MKDLENRFKDCMPSHAGSMTRSDAYDDTVAAIVRLAPEAWLSEGQAAVYKDQLSSVKGAKNPQEKLVHAFEPAIKAQFLYAKILRSCHSLDPGIHAFRVFKTWNLATILFYQPATQLEIEMSNKGYNPGYTKVCEWIDVVAEDPEAMLIYIQMHCDQLDNYDQGSGTEMKNHIIEAIPGLSLPESGCSSRDRPKDRRS